MSSRKSSTCSSLTTLDLNLSKEQDRLIQFMSDFHAHDHHTLIDLYTVMFGYAIDR